MNKNGSLMKRTEFNFKNFHFVNMFTIKIIYSIYKAKKRMEKLMIKLKFSL